MSESVHNLEIRVGQALWPPPSQYSSLLGDISQKMPNIVELKIETMDLSMEILEQDICRLIASLTLLEKITLPFYCLLPSIVSQLSHVKNLRNIEMGNNALSYGRTGDVDDFHSILESSSFPSLKNLHFCSSLEDARTFLGGAYSPAFRLTSLWLRVTFPGMDTQHRTSPRCFRSLLELLANACGPLERLEITMSAPNDSDEDEMESLPRITYSDFSCVARFRSLKAFSIQHVHPIEITDADAETLASQCPRMEELTLNAYPTSIPQAEDLDFAATSLSVRSLASFATHCPHLKSLALYLYIDDDIRHIDSSAYSRFKSLEVLNFGYIHAPRLARQKDICSILFSILPRGCELRTYVTGQVDYDRIGVDRPSWGGRNYAAAEAAYAYWKSVEEVLNLMWRTKQEAERMSRSRIHELEGEVALLKRELALART
ncbi:uncharacterized protein STEHIDRAFT_169604 [Stereum hirsutum FP-91666 SS1]|uniref:uncharacterized protein n=1 Tax=Stereum hirsutum (strain FP-91666) TaxID=721885 RepID=UPI0004449CBF|nr:uncharacterized protein STEHIDRAFT_169604 [Stereum hirsutum FP-91666 SS1]EIM84677.1 hypothetical protein STEHIDRAFT_169604 [Stereum hirsutum FP-91666 SS1]